MEIDSKLNVSMEKARQRVSYYGSFVNYGGFLVMVSSFIVFVIEFTTLYHISKYHKFNSEWVVEDQGISKSEKNLL